MSWRIFSLTEKKQPADKWFASDSHFNRLYPYSIRLLAKHHWTPLNATMKAVDFLASEDNTRILDIGSGVGKFCLAAAYQKPNVLFTGVEQRKELVAFAEKAKTVLGLKNASFINANFTQIDFKDHDHFYFYNSFYENLAETDKIDESIDYSLELYNYYSRYLYKQLEQKPAGTKIAAFHSLEDEMPPGYELVDVKINGFLKFWIKI